MPWLSASVIAEASVQTFSILHEAFQRAADTLSAAPFVGVLCPDPTLVARNPAALPVPRFIPEPRPAQPAKAGVFTIGSFGFAYGEKGFTRLCALVNEQFTEAVIRINLPPHDHEEMASREQAAAVVEECRRNITKPGIDLQITHDFHDDEQLLDFLAGNSINAFLYEGDASRGISSCIDYALASGRPIAVSASSMFRHIHGLNPSVCVEHRSLRDIAEGGAEALARLRDAWSPQAAGAAWNKAILEALASRELSRSVPDGRGFNKRLDDRSRNAYGTALAEMQARVPELLERKIPEANIQQAFGLDTAIRLARRYTTPRILAVGAYEDTTVATLKALGYIVEEVDPLVNGLDLAGFYASNQGVPGSFDMVVCISVLEHVEDDETFMRMVADLLAPDGVAVFTVDFSNLYPEHGRKPSVDYLLYTSHDLGQRLMAAMPDCALLDPPDWDDGEDDFLLGDVRYAFASWVFRKLPADQLRHVLPDRIAAGAPWKAALAGRGLSTGQDHVADFSPEGVIEEDTSSVPAPAMSDDEWKRELCSHLRMEEGPQALKAVLPLARLIRRLSNTVR
ncbi:methyltransferase domain-containing protein [Synechococcus sp. BA-120 BA3]|nr:methyltransferase domain-containing protein [Synechococcus sp. BA-120 BA3]